MAIENITDPNRRCINNNSASCLPASTSEITMRLPPPSISSSSTPCIKTLTHETVISIDRAGSISIDRTGAIVRTASLRPSRGSMGPNPTISTLTASQTPQLTGSTSNISTATVHTANAVIIPPLLPSRIPALPSPTPPANHANRRFNLLSSGFWIFVELFFTLCQIAAAVVVLAISQNERPETPLPVWVIGYTVGCFASLPLLYWRYHHQPPMDNTALEQGPPPLQHHHHQSTAWLPNNTLPNPVSHHDPGISTRAYAAIVRAPNLIRVEVLMNRLRMTLDCFFAIWFVLGNVWVFGRPSSAQESPKLYRLCVGFLALSCMSYAMPFLICAAVCCCLPCVISLLGIREQHQLLGPHLEGMVRGASAETIAALPIFKFRRLGKKLRKSNGAAKKSSAYAEHSSSKHVEEGETSSGSDQDSDGGSEGGVLGAGTEHERSIAGDDATCCICLGNYLDNVQLRGLPCSHHFHAECLDQWLKINASCPLCKFSIQGSVNMEGDNESTSTGTRRGRRLFEEV